MRREGWTEPLWEGSPGLLNVLGSGARQGSSQASWIRGQRTPDGKGGSAPKGSQRQNTAARGCCTAVSHRRHLSRGPFPSGDQGGAGHPLGCAR